MWCCMRFVFYHCALSLELGRTGVHFLDLLHVPTPLSQETPLSITSDRVCIEFPFLLVDSPASQFSIIMSKTPQGLHPYSNWNVLWRLACPLILQIREI